MGQHDALGHPRRPPRVLVHGYIFKAVLHRRGVRGIFCQTFLPGIDIGRRRDIGKGVFLQPAAEHPFQGRKIVADAGIDDLPDLGLGTEGNHPGRQYIQGDQDLGTGIVELMVEFRIGIEGVVHDGDGADLQDGEVGRHAGNDVGQQQGDGVPLLDPESCQTGGEPIHHILQPPETDRRSLKNQGRPIRKLFGRTIKNFRHTEIFIGHGFGNSLFI